VGEPTPPPGPPPPGSVPSGQPPWPAAADAATDSGATWQWPAPDVAAPGGWGPPPSAWSPPPAPRTRRTWLVVTLAIGGSLAIIGVSFAWYLLGGWGWHEWWDDWGSDVVVVGPDGTLRSLELTVGDCAVVGEDRPMDEVEPVACGLPHDLEVYLVGELDLVVGLSVTDAAMDVCEPAFVAFVGAAYTRSWYSYVAFVPDETRMATGNQDVVCAVYTWEEVVGSVEGSRR
jgi:hypothetical protein